MRERERDREQAGRQAGGRQAVRKMDRQTDSLRQDASLNEFQRSLTVRPKTAAASTAAQLKPIRRTLRVSRADTEAT